VIIPRSFFNSKVYTTETGRLCVRAPSMHTKRTLRHPICQAINREILGMGLEY